jgi:hypothetical protein
VISKGLRRYDSCGNWQQDDQPAVVQSQRADRGRLIVFAPVLVEVAARQEMEFDGFD